ncbi:MAG: 50S ribosomal protein L29 [Nanoarchaeota archaeon]|nr:50S ribosomal protein L29 [Nanoarchaeota archaeon]
MKIKAKDLRKLGDKELDNRLFELRKDLMKVNAQVASGTVPDNPGNVRNLKKTIARVHTIKTEKIKGVKNQVR